MHQDHRYIQALLEGDDPLIRDIYAHHAATVKVWVEKNGGNEADAKDVFQDALMAIARQARRPGWELTCPFGAYLTLVCKGKWRNELKRRRRAGVTKITSDGLSDDEDVQALAEKTLLKESREQLLWQKFETLGEGCKQLLKMAWSGRLLEEVARELGVTYGYVRKKKSRCIALLIDAIQNDPEYHNLKAGQP